MYVVETKVLVIFAVTGKLMHMQNIGFLMLRLK